MRSKTDGPQLPLLAVRYATFEFSPAQRKRNHPLVIVFTAATEGAQLSVSSLWKHGHGGQEPAARYQSVDVFRESR